MIKGHALGILVSLSLFVALATTLAYGRSDGPITVRIPFSFVVGNAKLPAGEYTLESLPYLNGGLLLRSTDGRVSKFFLARSYQEEAQPRGGQLVFHRYGTQYFLSQIRGSRAYVAYDLLPSRAELALAKSAPKSRQQVALHARQP